jgi:hypothetical protein
MTRQFRHVVDIVDQLHRFPTLLPFPLIHTKSRRENGAYNHRMRPSRPISIAVSVYADFPSLTLLHEVGHLLDHLVLNPIKQGFGSEHDPLFEPLRRYWSGSRLIRTLAALLERNSRLAPGIRTLIRYQMETPELWARTYLQWVVKKSDDLLLQACLASVRGKPAAFAGRTTHFCWEDAEMDDIIPLVDEVLSEAGLL